MPDRSRQPTDDDRNLIDRNSDKPDNEALPRIASLLLAVASLALAALLVCAVGWYRAKQRIVTLGDLSSEERQLLVDEMILVSPGAHQWAFFEPRIGYTLRPNAELEIWNSSFTSNKLGYRTAPLKKVPGTYRVVFVGDSWTYGMGVEAEDSFPEIFAQLANEHAGLNRRVEAWTLALPGYNLHNSLAGLDFFFNYLEPDAVVVVPSGNDNFSSNTVLPNGAQWSNGLRQDEFGEPHQITYRARRLNSYRFQNRWQQAFSRLRQTEERLERAETPLFLFFLARWQDVDVHSHVLQANLSSPYTIVPTSWTMGTWTNPPPIGHGTVSAQKLYGRLVYRGLAHRLGWPMLPDQATLDGPVGRDDIDAIPIFDHPPTNRDWLGENRHLLDANTRRLIPSYFRPPDVQLAQVAGPIDPKTGQLGPAATVLMRPEKGHRFVKITLRPLADAPFIYPMDLTIRIPSPTGGSEATVRVTAEPSEQHLSVPIPKDIGEDAALDIVMVAENSISSPFLLAGRSLIVQEITTSAEP